MSKIINAIASGFQYRYLARFVVESVTPLAVGSGETDLLTDSPVVLDVNGMPYIPGTALAGVVRHALSEKEIDTDAEWGSVRNNKDNKSYGSHFILTEARILNSKGKVMDGMVRDVFKDSLLEHYAALPIRQHARITEKGTVADAGKYDGQVVFAGTRFCFEIEWLTAEKNDQQWIQVISEFMAPSFRIGGGTRCGYGELKVVNNVLVSQLDLSRKEDLLLYLSKSSELEESGQWKGWLPFNEKVVGSASQWQKYTLHVSPQDLFMFSSAGGDKSGSADMTAVKEPMVCWENGIGTWHEDMILVPATSIKGAIAHRVAYHYNRLTGICMEQLQIDNPDIPIDSLVKPYLGGKNKAVAALFGSEGEYENGKQVNQQRGNALFSDIIMDSEGFADKLVNHVTIDDFTGAAIEGHLFTEKPVYGKGNQFVMHILVRKTSIEDENIRSAFEHTLTDICEGYLPLGGGVNRGNGLFIGTWNKSE